MSFASIFGQILQFVPSVLQGVIAVEQAIQAPGATKKQIIINSLQAAAQVGETVPNNAAASLSALIDYTVKTLNEGGVFGKDAQGNGIVNMNMMGQATASFPPAVDPASSGPQVTSAAPTPEEQPVIQAPLPQAVPSSSGPQPTPVMHLNPAGIAVRSRP